MLIKKIYKQLVDGEVMPIPQGRLRILFSVRTIFNLEEAHKLFLESPENPTKYIEYMRDTEKDPLEAGPLMRLYQACERINHMEDKLGYLPFNMGMCSKDDFDTQRRIFNSIGNHDIHDARFLAQPHAGAGYSRDWIRHYFNNQAQPSIFFTCNDQDAQMAVDDGLAASRIIIPEDASYAPLKKSEDFSWWFDLDAVAWGSSAELIYKKKGLNAFFDAEWKNRDKIIEPGPFTSPLTAMAQINRDLENLGIESPLKLHFCTARGGRAMMRASNSMQHYGHHYDHGHFMAGESKSDLFDLIRAEGQADLFMDDQIAHMEPLLVDGHTACGHVPYAKDSAMGRYLKKQPAAPK
tara:strand:+ start:10466 stop:11518 length:1053 start_codon:yes stop_codon:yes gene_type:complete